MARLRLWGLLFTSSIISMLSVVTTLDKRKEETWERHERWIMSVTCISIFFSFLGGLVSCLPAEQALKIECPIITICLGFWAAGMPALMDPDNELAASPGGGILNANLYFFGWGSLIAGILLAGDWAKQANGDDASKTAVQWVSLAASSFVLMGTSSATYNDLDCRELDISTTNCNRNLFAVILGICSGAVAGAMVPMKNAPPACQAIIALLLLASWGCGVAYITFDDGPGSTLGNVYFATWISLFLCANIVTTCINLVLESRGGGGGDGGDEGDEKADAPKDIEKENSNEDEEVGEEAPQAPAAETEGMTDAETAAKVDESI